MFLVFGIGGFVSELAVLHEGNGDAKEEGGHGYRTEDKPIYAIKRGVHDPNTPPKLDLTEIVRVTPVFPKPHIAHFSRMSRTEIVALFVGYELDCSGREADEETEA